MADGQLGRTVVVKCGGVVTEQPELLCADLAERHRLGKRLVLVHGASGDIDRIGRQLGVPQRRLVGPGRRVRPLHRSGRRWRRSPWPGRGGQTPNGTSVGRARACRRWV